MSSAVDFEKSLVATLKANTALIALIDTNKIFPLIIPQGTDLPCISYQRIEIGRQFRTPCYAAI